MIASLREQMLKRACVISHWSMKSFRCGMEVGECQKINSKAVITLTDWS